MMTGDKVLCVDASDSPLANLKSGDICTVYKIDDNKSLQATFIYVSEYPHTPLSAKRFAPIENKIANNKSMTRDQFIAYHLASINKMHDITKRKNADYTGASDDPFANFKLTDAFGVTSVEAGFFTRMTDKFSRLASFIKKGVLEVKDESIEDTLLDLANYCIIMAAYIKSEKDKKQTKENS